MPSHFRVFAAVLSCAILGAAPSAFSQASSSATIPVTTTVTVLGPKFTPAPPIPKQDVSAYSAKERLNVTKWVPAQGQSGALQLAVVIDNDASQLGVATQLNDIKDFISLQSPNTAIGLFYAMYGTVEVAAPFSTNRAALTKALRPPLGLANGASPSIYLSHSDLVNHHWPSAAARREVLLISNGVDQLDRGPQSPYVQAAVEDVQKAGVVVHTIYTGGSIRFGASLHGQYAQANLEELTEGSGGYGFFQGITAPVSFAPYLNQLNTVLHNQYLLTVAMPQTEKEIEKGKAERRALEVRLEERNLEIKYPKQVLVPGTPK
jgi:hypothetical protein